MWIAQTEATRHGSSHFEHLSELPIVELGSAQAHVLIGEFGGVASDASLDHPAVGLDLALRSATEIETDTGFEYGVVPVDRTIKVDNTIVEPGSLALVPPGRGSLRIETRDGRGRLLVIGGQPLGERIKMWWNFVARTQDEITESWRDWTGHNEDRFGPVPSGLERMEAPTPPWIRE